MRNTCAGIRAWHLNALLGWQRSSLADFFQYDALRLDLFCLVPLAWGKRDASLGAPASLHFTVAILGRLCLVDLRHRSRKQLPHRQWLFCHVLLRRNIPRATHILLRASVPPQEVNLCQPIQQPGSSTTRKRAHESASIWKNCTIRRKVGHILHVAHCQLYPPPLVAAGGIRMMRNRFF